MIATIEQAAASAAVRDRAEVTPTPAHVHERTRRALRGRRGAATLPTVQGTTAPAAGSFGNGVDAPDARSGPPSRWTMV